MRKTNRFIYAYQVNWENNLNLDYLKESFPEDRWFENLLRNKDYISLIFLGEEEGIVFFQLLKGKGSNASVIDLEEQRHIPHYLDNNKKLKNYGLLAFIEDKNVLLTLFNHEAFGHSTGTLVKYLKAKINRKIGFEIITKEAPRDHTKRIVEDAKNITIKKAQKDYRTYEKKERGKSRNKLIRYIEGKETNYKLQRIKDLPHSKIIEWIRKIRREESPDRIIIDTYSQGEIDILDEIYLRFSCRVRVDEDDLAIVDDFKSEIKRIVSENEDTFDGY